MSFSKKIKMEALDDTDFLATPNSCSEDFPGFLKDLISSIGYDPVVVDAAIEAQGLRDRTLNPAGSFDKAGRFSLQHRCECCDEIRSPSRAYPYSEMVHGRSVAHVSSVHDVEALHVKRALKALDYADDRADEGNFNFPTFQNDILRICKPIRKAKAVVV